MKYDIPRLLALLDIDATKKGTEYEAKCPYHVDNNPSWSIQAESGLNHCFACSEGGGAATLVAKVLEISTYDAINWLHTNGITGETSTGIPESINIAIGAGIIGSFKYKGYPGGDYQKAYSVACSRGYLRERGVTQIQALTWHIEYCCSGPLAGRITFPIHDVRGNLVGFMARTITGARPRYMTPEPDTFPDKTAIFGEGNWPKAYIDCAQVVVTEGAINALACERAGAKHIAALGGSNPSLTVYSKLAQFGRVIIATDPDRAGERCATALQVLKRWTKVTRVDLPAGLDAANLSSQELQERLMAAGLVV